MKTIRLMMFMILCMAAAWPVYATNPQKKDFAYGIELTQTGQEALCSFSLPLDVYKKTVRRGLADMAVFNNQEEPVPFAVWRPPTRRTSTLAPVPFYPIYGSQKKAAADLAVMFKTDAQGTLVSLRSSPSDRADRRDTIISYLADLSKIEESVNALDMDWKRRDQNFIRSISIAVSDDLHQWRTIADGETMAGFYQTGRLLERRLIEFPSFKARYLRIETMDSQGLVELEKISVRLTSIEEPARQWVSLTAEPVAKKEGAYAFLLPGHLPVDRLRIWLPQPNTIVKTEILSRKDGASVWISRQHATIYRLKMEGAELLSLPIAVSANGDRHWQMRVDPKGGGLGSGIVKVDAGWTPHLLFFTTRGEAPFVLAYGNGRIQNPLDQGGSLLKEIKELMKNRIPPCVAEGSPPFVLAGEKALKKNLTPQTYKQLGLWSILIFTVLAMAVIVLIQIRQMTIGKGGKR